MISIIVPVYQVEKYLHQCIYSILAQTYRDLEILLIDDGSPDKCGEICDEYALLDNRIRVFHTENNGLSAARNFGLRESRGEYVGFVDSDDWIEPDMYEVLLKKLEEEGADISTCEYWRNYEGNRQVSTKIQKDQKTVYADTDALQALPLFHLHSFVWNKLFRKECWTDIWFPDGHTFEDVATLYKVFLKAHLVSRTPKMLYHYRIREDSISHDYSMNNTIDCWNAFYRRYLFLSAQPKLKNNQIFIDEMETWLASLAVRIWQRAWSIPSKERDYAFYNTIFLFVRTQFPLFGKKTWELPLRVRFFFTMFASSFSFACLFFLDSCFIFTKKICDVCNVSTNAGKNL